MLSIKDKVDILKLTETTSIAIVAERCGIGMRPTIVVTAAGRDCRRITVTAKRSCLLPFSYLTARVSPTNEDQMDLNT